MHSLKMLAGLLLFNLPARALRTWLLWRRGHKRTVLKLRLSGQVVEERGGRASLGVTRSGRVHLPSLLRILDEAGRDPSVEAIALNIGRLEAGWAQLDEIREAITVLQSRGRQVFAYLERPGHPEYHLATVCDRVAVPPLASLDIVGLRTEVTWYKGALDLLGVQAHFEAAGEYKSFGEPFTRDQMSPAFRESLDAVLRALHGRFVAALARGRGIDVEAAQGLIDGGPWSAEDALERGLVDDVLYPDRWKRAIRRILGDKVSRNAEQAADEARPDLEAGDLQAPVSAAEQARRRLKFRPAVSYLRLWGVLELFERWGVPRDRVAVVVAAGQIIDSDLSQVQRGRIALRPLANQLAEARDDPRVKAVVLRVDSPGGSGLASDLLWRELRRLRRKKPVVASMANTAASGGYYLAMAADHVVAAPATITGSIGVVAGKFDVSGLLEKVGLRREVFSYGENSSLFSPSEGLNEATRARLREQLSVFYDAFVDKAAKCRGRERDALEAHARGRIWTGTQAKERGLVDATGGLRDAIAEAAHRGGCGERWDVVLIEPARPSMLHRAQGFLPGVDARAVVDELADELSGGVSRGGLIQARLPVDLRFR